MSQAIILNLQRFCLNDGPGIRTTVFFKGCPLHCVWCHNPESQNARKELFYSARSCIGCRKCAVVCPQNCHGFEGGLHLFNRKACTACGQCAAQCPAKALEMIGTERSTQEILSEALQDKTYYELSGGGITLSGGEPMMQFQAAYELLKQAKEAVLHTAMETCGAAPAEHFRQIAEVTDLFLYDYKETDPALHRERTGVSNRVILENLRSFRSAWCKHHSPMSDHSDSERYAGTFCRNFKNGKQPAACQRNPHSPLSHFGKGKVRTSRSFRAAARNSAAGECHCCRLDRTASVRNKSPCKKSISSTKSYS